MNTVRTIATAALAGAALSLAACDSAAENQVEGTAEAIDESYEAEADMIREMEAGGPLEDEAEMQADALEDQGEEIKDDLEDAADNMDATPQ